MAKDITIQFDQAKLRSIQKLLRDIPRALPKVISRGINKTATTARAEMARKIATDIAIKISHIKKGISLSKATYSRWQAELDIYGNRLPLIDFTHSPTSHGINYQIDRKTGRKFVASAFIQTMPTGHVGIFKRKTLARYPMRELYGPSVGYVVGENKDLLASIMHPAESNMVRNIDYQVAMVLAKRRIG